MLELFATNAPDRHHWTLNSSFGAFLSVRVHFGPFLYCTKLGAKRAKLVQLMLSCHDFALEFFATNAPDPHHWTLNSCFGRFFPFECILKQFRYCTKLGAKQPKLVQLLQKFVQRCLVRILRNERSRSTPLDPKLIFWCVYFRLGAFGTISLLHETLCKMGQPGAINARVRATKSLQNFSKRTLPIHTIGP